MLASCERDAAVRPAAVSDACNGPREPHASISAMKSVVLAAAVLALLGACGDDAVSLAPDAAPPLPDAPESDAAIASCSHEAQLAEAIGAANPVTCGELPAAHLDEDTTLTGTLYEESRECIRAAIANQQDFVVTWDYESGVYSGTNSYVGRFVDGVPTYSWVRSGTDAAGIPTDISRLSCSALQPMQCDDPSLFRYVCFRCATSSVSDQCTP